MTHMNKKYIMLHTSDVSEKKLFDQFNSINNYHRDVREFSKSTLGNWVGYHSLITGGKNYKCKEDWEIGSHCNEEMDEKGNIYPHGTGKAISMNVQALGACWGGDGDIEFPSDIHYKLWQKQVWDWQDKYSIPNENVFFHRKFNKGKTCPGSLITEAWLKKFLTRDVIPTNSCTDVKVELEEEKKKVSNLQAFINFLLNLIK